MKGTTNWWNGEVRLPRAALWFLLAGWFVVGLAVGLTLVRPADAAEITSDTSGLEYLGENVYITSPGVVVERITVHGGGIVIRADNVELRFCRVYDAIGEEGIHVDGSGPVDTWPRNAWIHDNYVEHSNYGIVAEGDGHLIERNEVYRVTNEGVRGDADYARYFGTGQEWRFNFFHGTTLQDSSGANGVWEGGGSSDDGHVDGWQSFINDKPAGTVWRVYVHHNVLSSFGLAFHCNAQDGSHHEVLWEHNVVLPESEGARATLGRIRPIRAKLDVLDSTFIGTSEAAVMINSDCSGGIYRNAFVDCHASYGWNEKSSYVHGDNLIWPADTPAGKWQGVAPEPANVSVDPGVGAVTPPADWAEAFDPGAPWWNLARGAQLGGNGDDEPKTDEGLYIGVTVRNGNTKFTGTEGVPDGDYRIEVVPK